MAIVHRRFVSHLRPGFAAAAVLAVCSGVFGGSLQAQGVPGPATNNPGTRLNLGGLGGSSNTPTAPAQRVLQGVVQDKEGVPVKGAIVYLKNDRTAAVRSMTADDKGTFRFVQLSRTAEYKVWAQVHDKKSTEKAVSSFETRDEITRNLKIE